MSSCLYCGSAERNFASKFCTDCGNNWPANQVVDQTPDVLRYVDSLYQSVQSSSFDDNTDLIKRMRTRFKISHGTHQRIVDDLRERLQIVESLHTFTLEFNQNDSDAYAEQDTLLQFRLINDANGEQLKSVSLTWDDPDSASGRAFRASTSMPVRPGSTASLQGSHVFMRFGPKSIDRMVLSVENLLGDVCEFGIEAIVFNVRNPDQKISKNITNNISMERGVLDNSTNLADADGSQLTVGRQAVWTKVNLFPIVQKPEQIEALVVVQAVNAAPVSAPAVEAPVVAVSAPVIEESAPMAAQETAAEVKISPDPAPPTAPSPVSAEPEPVAVLQTSGSSKGQGDATTTQSQDPARCDDLRTCAHQLLRSLSWFAASSPITKPHTVITSDQFDLDFLDVMFHTGPDSVEDAVLGMVFADGESVVFDQHNYVINFDCHAFMVSDHGITIVSVTDNTVNAEVAYSWGEVASMGWGFYARKFAGDKYVVSFGDGSLSQTLPGCKFDLRQYQGELPIAHALAEAEAWLHRLFELAPAHVEEDDLEEPEVEHEEVLPAQDSTNENAEIEVVNNASAVQGAPVLDESLDDLDPEIADEDEDEDDEDEARQQTLDEIGSRMQRFFGKLDFVLQRCDENQAHCVYTRDRVHDDLLQALHDAAYSTGSGMRVICIEPGCALLDEAGLLIGWKGTASALSAEGIFHMVAQPAGGFLLDGSNAFLSWTRFFGELGAHLIVREEGPDLWLGTPMNYLIRGCYVDYSVQVLQWDYFENYVQSELHNLLNLFRESVDWL